MPTLTENATALALGLAIRHISKEPTLADAEVFLVGRPHLWSGWESASEMVRAQIITLIRYRPVDLNQTGRFLEEAGRIIFGGAPFRVASADLLSDQQAPPRLKETDVYYFQVGFDLDGLIEEKLCAIKTESTAPSCTKWPTEGQILLRETHSDGYRTFVISEAQRSRLVLDDTRLPLVEASDVTTFSWEKASLYEIARALDQAGCDPANHLHQSHRISLNAIVRNDGCVEAHAGKFYRVNAPTGTGKTVVMQLMGIHTALQRHRVVIAVPNLTDVRNMVEALKRSVRIVAPHLKIAPLHSQRRIAKAGDYYFARAREDHPYDYRCLLDACATDGSVSPRDEEPCFNLQLPGERRGRETFKRIRSCPFLNQCGKRTMLEQALAADIVVVNHHALISGTTRIATEGGGGESRSLLELLLRSASLFMVDEIDGLLLSAIDTSVFELPLSNHIEHSNLAELHMEIFGRDSIPDVDASTLYRAQRACNAVILHTTRLLQLALKHLTWPDRETVWERAEDQMIADYLGVDPLALDGVCGYGEQAIPPHLAPLRELLQAFSHNDPLPSPVEVVVNIGALLSTLAKRKNLGQRLNDKKLERLRSSLVIRTSLHFIESSLRTLYADVPVLARAKVAAALRVQQDLSGSAPFSPTPLGPLQRVVYGFKRKQDGRDTWSLQVPAIRARVERFYDCVYVDEVQDFAGHDFNLLLGVSKARAGMVFVGDFYQHTFDTSRDGTVNKTLHDDIAKYEKRFRDAGITVDKTTLGSSWRCAKSVCDFINVKLQITMGAHEERVSEIVTVSDQAMANALHADPTIVKLFLKEHYKYGCHSQNWGASKGMDHFHDVCVVMGTGIWKQHMDGKLHEANPQTKNKLYVACSRARGALYFVPDKLFKSFKLA